MRLFLSFLLFFSIHLIGKAQVLQQDRVEIPIDELSDNFSVTPVGEHGLIVFGETDQGSQGKEAKWRFYKYNTDFEKVDARTINIDRRFISQGYYLDSTTLYLLFSRFQKGDDYKIVRLDVETFESRSLDGAKPKDFEIEDFKVLNNYLYAGGYTRKGAAIGYASLKNRILKLAHLGWRGENEVDNIEINEEENTVDFVISNYRKNDGLAFIHTFKDGKEIDVTTVTPRGENNLLSAKVSLLDDGQKVVTGTFAKKRQGASGMYITRLTGEKQDFISYHDFADFENFFSYLPQRKQEKMEAKKERKEKKGKELKLKYQLLTHDVIVRDDQYILISEAYYKDYRTDYRYETIYFRGRYQRVYRPREVFDGYQYTHGIVAAFDKDGNRLWDNTFEMNDYKSFVLKERIKVNVKGDEIDMAYGAGRFIKSKIIRGDEVVDRKSNTHITTGEIGERIKQSYLTNLEYWFDQYFIVWGFQKIKDDKRDRDGKKNRKVFYFNKLSIE